MKPSPLFRLLAKLILLLLMCGCTQATPVPTLAPTAVPTLPPTAESPSPVPPAGEYIISGGADPAAGIYVDDYLRVFVNNVRVAEVQQGGRCCAPVPPIRFKANPGDLLRVQAQDANNCYSLEAIWLQPADGGHPTQLTGNIAGPNCNAEPPGQIFFDKTVTLP